MDRWLEVEIEGCDAVWRVVRASLEEAIHAPFMLEIIAYALDEGGARHDVAPADLIGKSARATWAIDEGGEREAEGLVERAEAMDTAYRLVVAPRVAVLADAVDYQVFVDRDALDITRAVLSKHGLSVTGNVTRTLPKRAQCVQTFESDLGFVSRILAEEGIAWTVSGRTPSPSPTTRRRGATA